MEEVRKDFKILTADVKEFFSLLLSKVNIARLETFVLDYLHPEGHVRFHLMGKMYTIQGEDRSVMFDEGFRGSMV